MEEEDKKAELDSAIWKKHQKKEAKNIKKIFITVFLLAALIYIVKFLMVVLNKESEDKIEQYDNEVYNEEILISK